MPASGGQTLTRMPYVTANGIQLYYEREGQGEPLVLIAGYTCDLNQWVAVRAALAQRFSLLLADNRGAGRSAVPDTPWSVADMADDVAALLREVGIARAGVLGHSLGGAVALTLAQRHPELVAIDAQQFGRANSPGHGGRVSLAAGAARARIGARDAPRRPFPVDIFKPVSRRRPQYAGRDRHDAGESVSTIVGP